MKRFYVFIAAIVVSILVALTYFYFEYAVRHSINYIWDNLFNTNTHRFLVIPICVVLSLIYFGMKHFADPKSDKTESHGLGDTPSPTIVNFVKVICIGFGSLVAGASLGPEAILVPASLVIGGFVAVKLFKKDIPMHNFLAVAAFAALFAAFFNSFVFGLLGMLLITKQLKLKLDTMLVLSAVLASAVTVLVLKLLESSPYTVLPNSHTKITVAGVLVLPLLLIGGYLITYMFSFTHDQLIKICDRLTELSWWIYGLIAATVLSIIYLLGGTLVEFTGNEFIVPMLHRSASLGFIGLLWILFIKIIAMAWSKTSGYRGGLIFPSIFLASVLVAIAQLYLKDINFEVCLITVLIGLFAANSKVKVLF